jgi:hypothetical protein
VHGTKKEATVYLEGTQPGAVRDAGIIIVRKKLSTMKLQLMNLSVLQKHLRK